MHLRACFINKPTRKSCLSVDTHYIRNSILRSLHNRDVPQVSPGALRLRFLSEAAEQRHLQGAERQALLSRLLRKTVRLRGATELTLYDAVTIAAMKTKKKRKLIVALYRRVAAL